MSESIAEGMQCLTGFGDMGGGLFGGSFISTHVCHINAIRLVNCIIFFVKKLNLRCKQFLVGNVV